MRLKSRSDKSEPPVIRPLSALLALAAGVGLSATLAWASSTEVGQTTATPVNGVGTPIVAVSTVAGTPSYETPDGVLTRWRFHSSSDLNAGGIRLKIFRFIERVNSTKAKYEFVAESSFKVLAPDTPYEFNERIPVKQGYLLGLLAQDNAEIEISAPGTDNKIGQFPGGDIPLGGTGTSTTEFSNLRVSVAATVESDADDDGFGDDTQDKCPSDPARQDPPCASTTGNPPPADTRAPSLALAASSSQDVVAKRAVFVNVTSDENGIATGEGTLSVPGASKTFKLKSDSKTVTAGKASELKLRATGKALRAVKRSLGRGKRVRATATVEIRDAAGNIATAKRTVKVKRPKRR
jgi:hypothetical protein